MCNESIKCVCVWERLGYRFMTCANQIHIIQCAQQQNNENNYIPERHYPLSGSASAIQYVESQHEWEDVVIIPPASHYGGSSGHVLINGLGQVGFSGSPNVGAAHHHKSGVAHGNSVPRHRTSYVITKLRYATNYEVRVQARNLHGWNKLSQTFHFSTQSYEGECRFSSKNGHVVCTI